MYFFFWQINKLKLKLKLSPSRGLGRKINEQDRSSIESEDKSRCSDRYFGFFYHNSRNCTNGNAYCKIYTIMRLGRILGPVSSFLIRHFLYLCAICAWRMAFPIPDIVRDFAFFQKLCGPAPAHPVRRPVIVVVFDEFCAFQFH